MSGVPDYPLESTIDFKFTSRSFSTGAPTSLIGTPVVEIYEDNSITQITAAETLTVDFDSITGLNNLRVVATAANGFEAGKSYQCVLSAGTVGGVPVVGEVVAQFSIERAPVNWANVTAPTTAVDLAATDIQLCDTITTYTGNTVQTGDSFARIGLNGAGLTDIFDEFTDIKGPTWLSNDTLDNIRDDTSTIRGRIPFILNLTSSGNIGVDWANVENPSAAVDLSATDIQLCDTTTTNTDVGIGGVGLTDLGGMSTGMMAEVESEVNDALNTAIAELGVAAPTATPTIRTGLMLLYMMARNQLIVQTSGTDAIEVYNNAGTKIAAKLITDDGSDYTEAEMA